MITTICKIFLVTFDPVVANCGFFANNKHVTLVGSRSMTLNIRAKYMHIWSTEKLKQPFVDHMCMYFALIFKVIDLLPTSVTCLLLAKKPQFETSLSGHLKVFRHFH